ncbi:carboxymuconolactone decarboxylase family protein [Bordetella sp. FB-8]|uniref:carboxymuconolactone decarboxylase family protein n=1 Tax=Bordetella sp. FB-8 TaxID=1159870 RepID=UPI0009DB2AA4|nr:carboxymuconolactone decarboxylase family protein [Bordetella sp. FB-8]
MDKGIDTARTDEDRYRQGWQKLKQIDGEAGERVVAALAPVAPDFGRLMIEFGFGDIYSRPQLDLRAREIATIAALAALGNAQPQLKVHIEAALNVGCTRDEIVEVFMQMAVYAGFPAALNALFAAHEVFVARVAKADAATMSAPPAQDDGVGLSPSQM